ncbi:MAG: hypothetical protein AABX17_00745 [Nanoarchaeota archaeon]
MAKEKEIKLTKEERETEEKNKEKSINDIAKIIAAINPYLYANSKSRAKIIKLKNAGKFWEAVKEAEPASIDKAKYELSYNSSMESLEPIYFWILDFMGGPEKVTKLTDNFSSSPGSGHFSELMGKGTRMQEESMKVMQTIGVLVKSVINIIYDLRQFEIRLNDYKAARSENKGTAEAGGIALKQIWMDNVDIKRGNTSIKALAFSQASFATLIDAFMMAKSIDEITNPPEKGGLDLNERVKNILKQRYIEFDKWRELSEKELQKRYNIQKSWLRSQVNSMKLYSRWAAPYLKAAEDLRMNTGMNSSSAMIKTFNTMMLQLTVMNKNPIKIEDNVHNHILPRGFDKLEEQGKIRKTFGCTIVDFKFRGIPQRVEQHYGFGGKSDVTFTGYALNSDEIDELTKRLEESDINQAMKLVEDATQTSLKEIQEDIDYFLKDEDERKKEEKEKDNKEENKEDINPFAAIISWDSIKDMFKFAQEKKEKRKTGAEIKPDNYAESVVRKHALAGAMKFAFTVYDVYKKAHGMASQPFGDLVPSPQGDVNVNFKDIFKK